MTPFDGMIQAGTWALLAVAAFWAGARLAGQATDVSSQRSRVPVPTKPASDPRRRR